MDDTYKLHCDLPIEVAHHEDTEADTDTALNSEHFMTSEQAYWWGQSLTSGTQDDDS